MIYLIHALPFSPENHQNGAQCCCLQPQIGDLQVVGPLYLIASHTLILHLQGVGVGAGVTKNESGGVVGVDIE